MAPLREAHPAWRRWCLLEGGRQTQEKSVYPPSPPPPPFFGSFNAGEGHRRGGGSEVRH